jgi:hypothetical protein
MKNIFRPQERWRYTSTQRGRHAVCQDGPADEEAQKTKPMRSKKSCMFMILV